MKVKVFIVFGLCLVVGKFALDGFKVRNFDSLGDMSSANQKCYRLEQYISPTQFTGVKSRVSQQLSVEMTTQPDLKSTLNSKTPKQRVSMRIGSVFPGETNQIIARATATETFEKAGSETLPLQMIEIQRPQAETVFIQPPKRYSRNLKLVEAVDLNQDGKDEIIAISDNGNSHKQKLGAFFIYNADHLDEPLVFQPTAQETFADGMYGTEELSSDSVKIYQTRSGSRVVVVAFGVAETTFDASVWFYSLDTAGKLHSRREVIPAPCHQRACNDALAYPMIAVDDLDGDTSKEVVVVGKSRVLVFAGEGSSPENIGKPLYFTQFVDPKGTYANYDAFQDLNGPVGPVGYRYGHIQIVRDLDGDHIKDLVVAADALPNPADNNYGDFPHTILQAFKLFSPHSGHHEYLPPLGPQTSPTTSPTFTGLCLEGANRVFDSIPGWPELGCTLDGIQDVTQDSLPEVVISRKTQQTAKSLITEVYSFQTASGWKLIAQFDGICLAVDRFDSTAPPSQLPPDIVVWNPQTRAIEVYRWQAQTTGFVQLPGSLPAPHPPKQFATSNTFSLSNITRCLESHGTDAGFHTLHSAVFHGKRIFLQDVKTTKGRWTLHGWTTDGGTIQPVFSTHEFQGKIRYFSTRDGRCSVYVTPGKRPNLEIRKNEILVPPRHS